MHMEFKLTREQQMIRDVMREFEKKWSGTYSSRNRRNR